MKTASLREDTPSGARSAHPAIGALAAALLLSACAGSGESLRTTLPQLGPGDTDRAAGFETPPVERASELLPPELLAGPHHRVAEEVRSDGYVRLYRVESDFGDFAVRGDDRLRVRVREIRALAALDAMSKRQEFAAAVARSLQSPFVAAWNLVTDPVDTIAGVPQGAWESLVRTSRLARSERGELESSAFREFMGFEAHKRELAYQLGVDPYSSNPELQRQLNRFAWASFLGGVPGMFVPFRESLGDVPPPTLYGRDADDAERVREILLHYSPEDLRRLNRIELAVMGISEPVSDAFARSPWYSPRTATLLVEALAALELAEGREAFVEAATAAESEDDALFYQRAAEMLRAYGDSESRIERVVTVAGGVAGLAENHTLVVPFPVDHAVWTRPTAEFARSLPDAAPAELGVTRTELRLTGTLSPRCRAELERVGLAVTERALERPLARQPEGDASGDPGAGG